MTKLMMMMTKGMIYKNDQIINFLITLLCYDKRLD